MKFKNYKNTYTNDNRIYSKNELYNMSLRELSEHKNELLAQYKTLGLPSNKELSGSDNVVYVEAYTKDDGTEVKSHWRGKPNSVNANKEVLSDKSIKLSNSEKELYVESEKQRSIERKDPEKIAGVEQKEPKSLEEIIQNPINPNIGDENCSYEEYTNNCQCCVAAEEAQRRGYDVNAAPRKSNSKADELSHNGFELWIDPKSELPSEPVQININKEDCLEYLNKNLVIGERYAFAYYDNDEDENAGHVVTVEKQKDGSLSIHDPQNNDIIQGKSNLETYIKSITESESSKTNFPELLRIDNKKFNPYYINEIVIPRK